MEDQTLVTITVRFVQPVSTSSSSLGLTTETESIFITASNIPFVPSNTVRIPHPYMTTYSASGSAVETISVDCLDPSTCIVTSISSTSLPSDTIIHSLIPPTSRSSADTTVIASSTLSVSSTPSTASSPAPSSSLESSGSSPSRETSATSPALIIAPIVILVILLLVVALCYIRRHHKVLWQRVSCQSCRGRMAQINQVRAKNKSIRRHLRKDSTSIDIERVGEMMEIIRSRRSEQEIQNARHSGNNIDISMAKGPKSSPAHRPNQSTRNSLGDVKSDFGGSEPSHNDTTLIGEESICSSASPPKHARKWSGGTVDTIEEEMYLTPSYRSNMRHANTSLDEDLSRDNNHFYHDDCSIEHNIKDSSTCPKLFSGKRPSTNHRTMSSASSIYSVDEEDGNIGSKVDRILKQHDSFELEGQLHNDDTFDPIGSEILTTKTNDLNVPPLFSIPGGSGNGRHRNIIDGGHIENGIDGRGRSGDYNKVLPPRVHSSLDQEEEEDDDDDDDKKNNLITSEVATAGTPMSKSNSILIPNPSLPSWI